MPSRPSNAALPQLWKMIRARLSGHWTDRKVLEQYLRERDPDAFAELVRRHGRMVLGVCRRILRNADDADDAFQATFLVLVKNARSVARREAIGSYLYGVAYRVALKARAEAARRRGHERRAAGRTPERSEDPDAWFEVRPIIDEEVNRLPEHYRRPIRLCYFEGKTYEEAARLLGWPAGTASVRLARARELLRTRLTRRGLALSAGALAAALAEEAAFAAEPCVLGDAVAAAVVDFATAGAAEVPTRVIALTEGVVNAMMMEKLKGVAVVLLAVGVTWAGAALVGRPVVETPVAAADGPGKTLTPADTPPAPAPRPPDPAPADTAPPVRSPDPILGDAAPTFRPPAAGAPGARLRTRVGLINLTRVFRTAKSFQSTQADMRTRTEQLRKQQEAQRARIQKCRDELADPALAADRRARVSARLQQLERETKQQAEEAARELTDRQGKALTRIYREVEDAARRLASRDDLELVMFYTDAVTQTDFYRPESLQHKLTQPGALMPMVVAPGMDITDRVIEVLNLQAAATDPRRQ